jgi:hypothetical protein
MRLEAEMHEAGILVKGEDWTFHDTAGRWYRWDAAVDGHVCENGNRFFYKDDEWTSLLGAEAVDDGLTNPKAGVDTAASRRSSNKHSRGR